MPESVGERAQLPWGPLQTGGAAWLWDRPWGLGQARPRLRAGLGGWAGPERGAPGGGGGECVPSVLTFTDRQQKPSTLRRRPTACSRVTPCRTALKKGSVASQSTWGQTTGAGRYRPGSAAEPEHRSALPPLTPPSHPHAPPAVHTHPQPSTRPSGPLSQALNRGICIWLLQATHVPTLSQPPTPSHPHAESATQDPVSALQNGPSF